MSAKEVDIVVIGMGPGGEEVAGRLAEAGLVVAGVEARLVGGECPYFGCVPTKMMVRAAGVLAEGRRIPDFAGDATLRPDWAPVARRIRAEATDDWNDKAAADRFIGKGGLLFRGHGRITGPGEVTVAADSGDQVLRARRGIVINVGTEPAIPPVEGLTGTPYWTNRDAVRTERVPDSLIVLGGGAIGVELSQVFARFGSEVTVVEAGDRMLSIEEPESGRLMAEVFEREGIRVHTGVRATRVTHDGTFTLGLGERTLTATNLLVATGRRTQLGRLGIGAIGLDEDARVIDVDDRLRAAPGVWAIGDVTGKGAFTHVSMYQAAIVIRDILGENGPPADYRALPRVTFTDPEVGAVGLTEAQARERGLTVRTGITQVGSTTRGWIHRGEGFIKLVEDADRGALVGATSAGPVGGEVLGALAVAVHGEVPTERLRHMIYAYPTFHRGIESALQDLTGE